MKRVKYGENIVIIGTSKELARERDVTVGTAHELKDTGEFDVFFICTDQASGAYINGTVVEKGNSVVSEDTHRDGALGIIIGSMGPTDGGFGYFVEWEDAPGAIPTFIKSTRVRPLSKPN